MIRIYALVAMGLLYPLTAGAEPVVPEPRAQFTADEQATVEKIIDRSFTLIARIQQDLERLCFAQHVPSRSDLDICLTYSKLLHEQVDILDTLIDRAP